MVSFIYNMRASFFIQNMYQYVVSKEVVPPFALCISHPRQLLLLSNVADENVTPYKDVLILVEREDACYDQTVLHSLSDPTVSFVLAARHVHT